jgi:hypothetical protein
VRCFNTATCACLENRIQSPECDVRKNEKKRPAEDHRRAKPQRRGDEPAEERPSRQRGGCERRVAAEYATAQDSGNEALTGRSAHDVEDAEGEAAQGEHPCNQQDVGRNAHNDLGSSRNRDREPDKSGHPEPSVLRTGAPTRLRGIALPLLA